MPKREGAGASAERSPASRVRRTPSSGPVRVWSEATVTICVTEEPPQFVKFTTGHERMAPDDNERTIAQTEKAIYDQCESIVAARVKDLTRLVRAAQAADPAPARGGKALLQQRRAASSTGRGKS